MGLFNKKEKKVEEGLPSLPQLPKLPDFPDFEDYEKSSYHQLPSFPSNSIGTKFSQDSIKDAVSGGMKGDEDYGEGFDEDEMRRMQRPIKKPMTEEIGDMEEEFPENRFRESKRDVGGEAGPIFVRVDRFEEGLKLFENIKRQISDIEKNLGDLKAIKEKEENELEDWENELKKIKDQIEKINEDIFMKV